MFFGGTILLRKLLGNLKKIYSQLFKFGEIPDQGTNSLLSTLAFMRLHVILCFAYWVFELNVRCYTINLFIGCSRMNVPKGEIL